MLRSHHHLLIHRLWFCLHTYRGFFSLSFCVIHCLQVAQQSHNQKGDSYIRVGPKTFCISRFEAAFKLFWDPSEGSEKVSVLGPPGVLGVRNSKPCMQEALWVGSNGNTELVKKGAQRELRKGKQPGTNHKTWQKRKQGFLMTSVIFRDAREEKVW